jgi:ATP phosphoribosyltransferase regulatory subunit HisZ
MHCFDERPESILFKHTMFLLFTYYFIVLFRAVKRYVDNAVNRKLGRVDQEYGTAVVP